jgi:glutaredoxin/glutathione-dependent peroxiredoxin
MIKPGDQLPDATLTFLDDANEVAAVSAQSYFAGRRVILLGMPGPFTPTCSKNHLPGYLHRRDELRQLVDQIAVVAVTDAFAMDAWLTTSGARDQLDFLADGNCAFTAAMGLAEDRSADGMGTRARRFAMMVDDGIVVVIHVETDQASTDVTGADAMIDALKSLTP